MKRADAFRKVKTICQRLDEVDLEAFPIEPLKLYLFGSLLTDKPDPTDVDLVLIFELGRSINIERDIVAAMAYGRPLPFERASTHLRRGMKMVRLHEAQRSLEEWSEIDMLLIGATIRLIWKPGFDWAAAITNIEQSPQPWSGPRPAEAHEQILALREAMPYEERTTRLRPILAEIEAQD